MTAYQLIKLCYLVQIVDRGHLVNPRDAAFIYRLERLPDDTQLSEKEARHLNRVWLDNQAMVRRLENVRL